MVYDHSHQNIKAPLSLLWKHLLASPLRSLLPKVSGKQVPNPFKPKVFPGSAGGGEKKNHIPGDPETPPHLLRSSQETPHCAKHLVYNISTGPGGMQFFLGIQRCHPLDVPETSIHLSPFWQTPRLTLPLPHCCHRSMSLSLTRADSRLCHGRPPPPFPLSYSCQVRTHPGLSLSGIISPPGPTHCRER